MLKITLRAEKNKDKNISRQAIRSVALNVLRPIEGLDCQLVVSLVGDKTMRFLNKRFLEGSQTTDVLSFPVHEFSFGVRPDNLPPGPVLLGEVVVNVDYANQKVRSSGQKLLPEVQSLVAHGLRHLIGFHHP